MRVLQRLCTWHNWSQRGTVLHSYCLIRALEDCLLSATSGPETCFKRQILKLKKNKHWDSFSQSSELGNEWRAGGGAGQVLSHEGTSSSPSGKSEGLALPVVLLDVAVPRGKNNLHASYLIKPYHHVQWWLVFKGVLFVWRPAEHIFNNSYYFGF